MGVFFRACVRTGTEDLLISSLTDICKGKGPINRNWLTLTPAESTCHAKLTYGWIFCERRKKEEEKTRLDRGTREKIPKSKPWRPLYRFFKIIHRRIERRYWFLLLQNSICAIGNGIRHGSDEWLFADVWGSFQQLRASHSVLIEQMVEPGLGFPAHLPRAEWSN